MHARMLVPADQLVSAILNSWSGTVAAAGPAVPSVKDRKADIVITALARALAIVITKRRTSGTLL